MSEVPRRTSSDEEGMRNDPRDSSRVPVDDTLLRVHQVDGSFCTHVPTELGAPTEQWASSPRLSSSPVESSRLMIRMSEDDAPLPVRDRPRAWGFSSSLPALCLITLRTEMYFRLSRSSRFRVRINVLNVPPIPPTHIFLVPVLPGSSPASRQRESSRCQPSVSCLVPLSVSLLLRCQLPLCFFATRGYSSCRVI